MTVKPLNKPAADLPVIDFDDPALVRTRERARAKVEKLSAEIPRVAKPKAPEPVPQEPQIIEEEDIRANLLRQRLTRRRAPNGGRADMLRHPRVMHEEEVFANLAKTDSPVNRRLRRVIPPCEKACCLKRQPYLPPTPAPLYAPSRWWQQDSIAP